MTPWTLISFASQTRDPANKSLIFKEPSNSFSTMAIELLQGPCVCLCVCVRHNVLSVYACGSQKGQVKRRPRSREGQCLISVLPPSLSNGVAAAASYFHLFSSCAGCIDASVSALVSQCYARIALEAGALMQQRNLHAHKFMHRSLASAKCPAPAQQP